MFTFGYLFDENMDALLPEALSNRYPELRVTRVGDLGAPPKGTSDPDILKWCEGAGCVLVTNNRKSMPRHLTDHLNVGGHIPGILVITGSLPTWPVVATLWDIATLSFAEEYRDQIRHLSRADLPST